MAWWDINTTGYCVCMSYGPCGLGGIKYIVLCITLQLNSAYQSYLSHFCYYVISLEYDHTYGVKISRTTKLVMLNHALCVGWGGVCSCLRVYVAN